jgi:DNA-binding transcriptional LysR family regulator
LLGAFVRTHPQATIRLRVANTEAIAAGVLDHSVDIGCVEGPVAHPLLEVRPWRDDLLVVCAPPDHPLARKRSLKPADFAGARWVLREPGSATRATSERVLAQLPPGETVLELDQIEAIKQTVVAGLGIACLPAVAVVDALAAGRLKALKTPFLDLRRTLSLLLHRQKYRGAVVDAFLDSVDLDYTGMKR